MGNAQRAAVEKFRERMSERGLVRFEVVGAAGDRELLREAARRLAAGGPDADALRDTLRTAVYGIADDESGAVLVHAFRASPLADAPLDTRRATTTGRMVAL